MNMPNKSH